MSHPHEPVSAFGFDTQAADYDARAGLPESVPAAVACAVAAHCPEQGALLEIGAGTGQVGELLAARLGARYIGLDASAVMLAHFHARSPHALLVRADARAPWPVARERFELVFMSRVMHLLEPEHVARQLRHALSSRGRWLVGRRERSGESVQAELRRELQRSLHVLGYAPRGPQRGTPPSAAEPTRREHVVAEWTRRLSAAQLLESWRAKPGLCGVDVLETHKRDVLDRLERHAQSRLGSLSREHEHSERYILSWQSEGQRA